MENTKDLKPGDAFQAAMSGTMPKENLMITLRGRRIQNFKNQFKAVLLEGYEIFGAEIVEDVIKECREIFKEYENLMSSE